MNREGSNEVGRRLASRRSMQSNIPTYSKHRKKEPLVALLPPGGGGEVGEGGGRNDVSVRGAHREVL